jgi:hypothetical protein
VHAGSQGVDEGERWRLTAEALFVAMEAAGVAPNTTTFNALLAAHAASRRCAGIRR